MLSSLTKILSTKIRTAILILTGMIRDSRVKVTPGLPKLSAAGFDSSIEDNL